MINRSHICLIYIIVLLFLSSCGSAGKSSKKSPPSPPPEVQCTVTAKGLLVEWSPVEGAHQYTVFWGVERGEYRGLVNTDANSIILGGLSKGEMYMIAVTAWNGNGESRYSEEECLVYDDNPARAQVYYSKGQELMRRGNLSDAQVYMSAAIRLDPENAHAYKDRALLYEKMNRADLAAKDNMTAEKIFKKKPLSLGR